MAGRAWVLRRTAVLATLAAALLIGPLSAPAAAAAPTTHRGSPTLVFTVMTGAQEVPPADPDGFGVAVFALDPAHGTVCYVITVARLDGMVTAAHIHKAPVGVNGPIVIPLTPPTNGAVIACTAADPALIQDISRHPSDYYANVHTTVFPAGAVRGQLH
jgi:hypothetical protein